MSVPLCLRLSALMHNQKSVGLPKQFYPIEQVTGALHPHGVTNYCVDIVIHLSSQCFVVFSFTLSYSTVVTKYFWI